MDVSRCISFKIKNNILRIFNHICSLFSCFCNFYFTTSLRPIWEGDFYQVRDVFRRLDWQWLRAYMYRDFLHTLPFVFILCFLIAVKKNIALKWWLFYSLVFCTLYFFSFFLPSFQLLFIQSFLQKFQNNCSFFTVQYSLF